MRIIAGYTGTKQAAPILIEMIRKQEGLAGGFYTEITTIHQGEIYCAKASGNLEHLLATTDAEKLPGTVGIICSSPSHPEAENPAASQFIPGLHLSVTEPEVIAWSRVNASLYVGAADHGTYVATAPLAFPEDAREPYLLPAWSSGLVKKDGFTCKPMGKPSVKIAPVTPTVKAKAYRIVCDALAEGSKNMAELVEIVKPLFEDADYDQAEAVVCGVLSDIDKEGK